MFTFFLCASVCRPGRPIQTFTSIVRSKSVWLQSAKVVQSKKLGRGKQSKRKKRRMPNPLLKSEKSGFVLERAEKNFLIEILKLKNVSKAEKFAKLWSMLKNVVANPRSLGGSRT